MIRVGFSEVNITPELGFPLAGDVQAPPAEAVQWPLFGRTAVFDDGEYCAAVISLDLAILAPAVIADLRRAVVVGTDLRPHDVLVACSHTHRGPCTVPSMDLDPVPGYLERLQDWLVHAVKGAWTDRRPATLRAARITAPGWTYNRRQIYRGEQAATHGRSWGQDFMRTEGPEDHGLQILLAVGKGGESIGGLVNFSCHATVMGGVPVYSADYPGALTEALAGRHGGIFAFLPGASGNLSPDDPSRRGSTREWGYAHAHKMGLALAAKAEEALATGGAIVDGRVRTARTVVRVPQRRVTRREVELAWWYLQQASGTVDENEFTRRMYGHDYTFADNDSATQAWFAHEAIGMWEWQRRADPRQLIEDLEVQAIAIGNVAMIGFPVELFTEYGLDVKARSPVPHTLVVAPANGWHGYVPTRDALAHGGYEARIGQQSRLAPGAGEQLCAAALRLLGNLSRP